MSFVGYEEKRPGDLLKKISAHKQARATEAAEKSFYEFIKQAWITVDPENPFVDNWHIGAIAEHLTAVHLGQIRRLIINMPPGFAKSVLLCVMFPAFEWISAPGHRYLCCSYSEEFAIRDALRCRNLIESEWYQARWGSRFKIGGSDLQSTKMMYENDKTGYRISFGIKGGLGHRGSRVFCDDPHKVKQAESDAEREDACSSYKSTMTTRANNIHTAAWVIIMQRLHERDLAGQMMELGYQCLKIPMRYDPIKPWKKIMVDFRHVDPRTEFGQLLFPERMPEPDVALQELTFGSYMTSGQYQQEPSPADGGIYKRAWFCKYWCYPTDNLTAPTIRIGDKEIETELIKIDPKDLEEQGLSFDCTFKNVDDADFVVGQAWGRRRADRILLDQIRKRMDFPATCDAVEAMALKWPRATAKYVEDKANGPAVISSLKHKISGMIAVNPSGGKESRAQGVSPQYEAGNIWLPHPSIAPWVSAFIEEHIAFPNAAHDDCVDCASMILNQWLGGWLGYIEYLKRESAQEDAMKNRKEAIATGAQTVRCSACESMAVVQMSGLQGKRCSNCGHQFDRGASTYAPPKRGPEMRKQMR